MDDNKPQLKKNHYEINPTLKAYLGKYKRVTKTNVFYDDLLRFQGSIAVFDKNGEDRLWVRV